tara:strand:+ start:1304 stop:1870 length:567 start_codon:yes stop_codon:yes gene_type:complete
MLSIFKNYQNEMINKKLNIKYLSIPSRKLSQKRIKEICFLKNKFWKFGIKSQLEWFDRNVKSYDIHNCMFIKKELIGYTFLRKRKMILNKQISLYYLIDTVIILRKMRNSKLGNFLMNFNNKTILKSKKIGFLSCKNSLIKFYKKFSWEIIQKKNFCVLGEKIKLNGMLFNKKILKSRDNKKRMNFFL